MTQEAKILRELKNHRRRGVENWRLAQVGGLNWRARISEMRQDGHIIYCEHQMSHGRYTGVWKYYIAPQEDEHRTFLQSLKERVSLR